MWIIFFENIGHKYDLEVGWGGVRWVDPVWVWGWSSSKETKPYQIICSIYVMQQQDGLLPCELHEWASL